MAPKKPLNFVPPQGEDPAPPTVGSIEAHVPIVALPGWSLEGTKTPSEQQRWLEGRVLHAPPIPEGDIPWIEDIPADQPLPVFGEDWRARVYVRSPTVPFRQPPTDPFWRDPETLEATTVRCARAYWIGHGDQVWEAYQCRARAASGSLLCHRHIRGGISARKGKPGDPDNAKSSMRMQAAVAQALGKREPDPIKRLVKGQRQTLVLQNDPGLRNLYERYLEDEDLMDFRPQVALGKALLHRYLEISNLNDPDRVVGLGTLLEAPALRAISALERVVNLGVRYAAHEKKIGAVSNADLARFLRALRRAVNRFLKTDAEIAEFYAILRQESTSGRAADDQGGDEAVD